MPNFNKKTIISLLLLQALHTNANAQFYDLDSQGAAMPSGNYKASIDKTLPVFTDAVSKPEFDTSGDDEGFTPEVNPDIEAMKQEQKFEALPVASGFDAFSNQMFDEENIKEQLRDIKQLDYIGYLDPNFDEALWLGVSYDYAAKYFADFKNIKSIYVKKTMRDMLMAKARIPQSEKSWLALRLKTLIDMGNLSDAKLLLKEVKPKELVLLKNTELNSLYLQANMLDNQTSGFIKDLLEQDSNNLNYKKAFLINLFNQGKEEQAKLSFNAFTESNEELKNSDFAKIFQALLNTKELSLDDSHALDIYTQYLVALSPSLFTNVELSKFKDQTLLVALNNADSLQDKTKYAELLMQKYPFSYSLEYLTAVYEEYKFEAKDLSVPLKYIQDSKDDYANRALLFQASKIKGLNSTKALALKKLWESYDANSLANLKSLINEKTQDIAINSSIAWFSLDLLKNELKQAYIDNRTLNTLYENIDNAYMNTSALNLQIAVEFLRRTSLVTSDFDSIQDYKETLKAWFKSKEIKTPEDYNNVLKVLTLLDALDAQIPDDIWASLYEHADLAKPSTSNPVWLRLITSAMQNNEKAKSLLLVSSKFITDDEQSLDPQTLANIIACLNYLNMPQEMALVGINAIVK
jgi:hypothetical protein